MSSRDRADRLLEAFKRDLEGAPDVDVSDADRIFSELVARGELSQAELSRAFDKYFPPAEDGLREKNQALLAKLRKHWAPLVQDVNRLDEAFTSWSPPPIDPPPED